MSLSPPYPLPVGPGISRSNPSGSFSGNLEAGSYTLVANTSNPDDHTSQFLLKHG
jgi:hypothetical protein